jgi:hypothetical protein
VINQPIPRRKFLRGVGTAMALPLLDAMVPLSALAQSIGAKEKPNRLAFVFVPNGMHMPAWTPATEGTEFVLPYTMEPLKNVREKLLVLTGLTQDKARPNGDGPGDHARSAAAWLTGCQPKKTSGADIKVGISADQLAAQKVGSRTPFPSLEIGVERGAVAGDCDSGYSCAYSSCISWRGEATPVAKEVDPRLVFERLFASSDPYESAESRLRRQEYKKSILDFVMDDAKSLKRQLGTRDQRKLEEYFVSVREIEQRVEKSDQVAKQTRVAGVKEPERAPADYREHIRLMADMMALAFQTDLTRISTFMLANEGSNRSYQLINIPDGHHDLSHHGRNEDKQKKIQEINRFHVSQLAYLLEKLDSIKEGDGTLLDNSMVVYGGGISDGDRHNHDDLPILVAGRGAGTIKTGRHVVHPKNTPLNNLYLSLLDRMGVHAETLGDSTGKLQQLF